MKHLPLSLSLLALLLIAPQLSSAQVRSDVLLIERVQQSAPIERPENGVRMAEVESRFGPPIERFRPVGEPPITRWVYHDFTVYFEHELVIHSVVNRATAAERGPRPPR
ncbi:MAG TPA: hypothetical protein PKZ76_00555 [Xanthomonadaceae bacterium]|nr:hypothetical protein [Xanthomonadaceae bacterium]